MKTIVLPTKRSTFTFGLIGFDLSKLKEVKKADIIHIHWLKDGFINSYEIKKSIIPLSISFESNGVFMIAKVIANYAVKLIKFREK